MNFILFEIYSWSSTFLLILSSYVKLYDVIWVDVCNNIDGANFPAPDAHFDNTCLFIDALSDKYLMSEYILVSFFRFKLTMTVAEHLP